MRKSKESKYKVILTKLIGSDFFDTGRSPQEVIAKLSKMGFTLAGRQVGMISRMLTQACQDTDSGLEREGIPKEKRVGNEKWMFKKNK